MLTSRQTEVLKFIKSFTCKYGYPPTYKEIGKRFEFKSTNAAADHCKKLRAAGAVTWVHGAMRTLTVSDGF